MSARSLSLSVLARAGFDDLEQAAVRISGLSQSSGVPATDLLSAFSTAADPEEAAFTVEKLMERAPQQTITVLSNEQTRFRLLRILGVSRGLGEFFLRHPIELEIFLEPTSRLQDGESMRAELLAVVHDLDSVGPDAAEAAWPLLRQRYRRLLTRIAIYDLACSDQTAGVEDVGSALADLAGAALDAALVLAREAVSLGESDPAAPGRFPARQVAETRLAIIGMGKAGARELNYVSDVDVIFVGEPAEGSELSSEVAVQIGTRLAMLTMRAVSALAVEPPLWEVDPDLRPEGKDGALVRTLESHLNYYDRWAKSWEFQALLKARPLAGDRELGDKYVAGVAPKVWSSASRESFVESVQSMRERVTEHIPAGERDVQLKLGPGGLRDIEFTVQLLQLVHGQSDTGVRQPGTLPALTALAERGYVGRAEAGEFGADYRLLRLLEHRLQLSRLRRTHLMPRDERERRVLARATGLAPDAESLTAIWQRVRIRVRSLHERLFYRPLLAVAAALPAEELSLTNEQAEARLSAIGFKDPRGALAHIAALTAGVSRRAKIQQHLLPVLLQWFSEGADPDYGLLAFRRLSDALGSTHWYLRLLRDSAGAAQRLTRVLAGSRLIGELLERIPEAVTWLEDDRDLKPRTRNELWEETRAVLARHESVEAAARTLRATRRREVLRLALSSILGACNVEELGHGLSDVTENLLSGMLAAIRTDRESSSEFAIVGMGRFGGRELGFGSDVDVLYVYRPVGEDPEAAARAAAGIVSDLVRLTEDTALPFELDAGLRPEGRAGAIVRSLEAYRSYYERWSLTWEAQALLRARGVAGDEALLTDFLGVADGVRYPASISENDVREVKRIKARVENERLPQGADPTRHVKLGRGSLSDVEWFVQLLQLQYAGSFPALRVTSTLEALTGAVEADLVSVADAEVLRAAWIFASRTRSAMTLWLNRTSNALPADRVQLEGIARVLEYPPGSASRLEQDYLHVTRRARAVFERGFYGES